MEYIKRENGYVYLVKGDKGFETFYNMGKDIDSELWKDEVESITKKRKKKIKNNCL